MGPVAAAVVAMLFLSGAAAAETFDADAVARGAALSALGNCEVCHTADGGKPYAGGRPIDAKVGVIHSTNITPDRDTGIGRWSLADFTRAMRDGRRPDGTHLYPAFPYPYFTRLTDADIADLYAFAMTREAVIAPARKNDLPFPFNLRPLLAVWNALFLDRQPLPTDTTKDAEWMRGQYLVDALAHCGACHSPTVGLGAEDPTRHLDGGTADGWHAPALNYRSPAPVPWNQASLLAYLREGWHELHGAGQGPMQAVLQSTAKARDDDLAAIATYIAQQIGPPTPSVLERGERALARAAQDDAVVPVALGAADEGAVLFAGACLPCHSAGGAQPYARGIGLALSSSVHVPTPDNLALVILDGVRPPPGEAGFFMPGFRGALTDAQITAIINYVGTTFSGAGWPNVASRVRTARERGETKGAP